MASSDAIIQLRDLIGDRRVAMLTSAAPSGELHSRPLTLGEIDDNARLIFLVDANAAWVAGLRADEPVNLAFSDEEDKVWVSVAGKARLGEDRSTIHRIWTPAAEAFFPDGPESSNIRVLSVAASTAEYWDAPSSRVERLVVVAKALVGDTEAKLGDSGKIELS